MPRVENRTLPANEMRTPTAEGTATAPVAPPLGATTPNTPTARPDNFGPNAANTNTLAAPSPRPGAPVANRPDPFGIAATVAPAAPSVGLVFNLVKDVPTAGTSGLGSLAPTGVSQKLPASLDGVVKNADQALNLVELNDSFNPLKSVVGDYTVASDVFTGKGFVPVKAAIGGVASQLPAEAAGALAPLLNALPDISVVKTPVHQFNLGDRIGNRIVFYGRQRGEKDVIKVSTELRKEGVRMFKQMVHFIKESQGGAPEAILGDGVGGSTHVGGFSGPVRSDWPADYGRLDDNHRYYNANLFGVNYQNGVRLEIPQATKLAYADNADMWDAVLGMIVPFAISDPDSRYGNYTYNPLDGQDQDTLAAYAKSAATLDWNTIKKNHGAFYCAEGQYMTANMGPQSRTLIKKSQFGDTKLGALIEEFKRAPGLTREHPEIGWKHLLNKHLIDDSMYQRLVDTNRTAIYLDWVPESVEGWQKYEPIEPNGLIATPMTVATLAWSLLRRYLPREGISTAVSAELMKAYEKGNDQVKAGVKTLLGGAEPSSAEGKKALAELSFKASTGVLAGILDQKELKEKLTQQAGFAEITNDADKKKVIDIYNEFLAVLPTVTNQADLDKALGAVDAKLRSLEVERFSIDPNNPGDATHAPAMIGKRKGLMLYTAPAAYGVWAQTPFLAGTGDKNVIQYVATAMHSDQAKPGVP
ncbi:MAG: hypothetical protein K1X64_21315 [Myxococcaceae bacterium]|nr:hypothetical protein [Myxococcaceae bacterium]